MKKLKEFVKNQRKELINFIKNNKADVYFYLLTILSIYVSIGFYYYLIGRHFPIKLWNNNSYWYHIYAFANCFLLTIPYFFFKKRKALFFLILIIFDITLLSNVLYYRTYYNIMPLIRLDAVSNLDGLGDSIVSSLRLWDITLFLPTLLMLVLYYFRFKKKLTLFPLKIKLKALLVLFIVFNIFIILDLSFFFINKEKHDSCWKFKIFNFDQVQFTAQYGPITCWVWQFYNQYAATNELTDTEKTQINQWTSENVIVADTTSIAYEKKNLIYIQVESLEAWPINCKINNVELTPNLNKLLATYNHIFSNRVIPQTKNGRTSDATFIINTGMLPVNNGVVNFLFSDNNYYTIAKALKEKGNYNTTALIGQAASYWNQGKMNKQLGFDKYITITDFKEQDISGFGLSDVSFFKQSIDFIKKIPQPFYLQLTTLSSHMPFKLAPKRLDPDFNSKINAVNQIPEYLNDYINAVHYTDKAIGQFFESIKDLDFFKNTIFIIVGDHEGLSMEDRTLFNSKPFLKDIVTKDFFIPMIILNSPINYNCKDTIGQIDIYPTLIDLLGVKNYKWNGMGESALRKDRIHFAVKAKLGILGDTTNVGNKKITHCIDAWSISDLMIRKNYFKVVK